MKKIVVQFSGGLGNNLFQMSAGIAHADTFKKNIEFRKPLNLESKFSHEFDSLLFEKLTYSDKQKMPSNPTRKMLNRVDNKIVREILFYQSLRKINAPKVSGFVENILTDPKLRELRGYYQTYKYFEAFKSSIIKKLNLNGQTKWFFEKAQEIEQHDRLASVHIRAGDYKLMKNKFGLLSKNYYVQAFNDLRVIHGVNEYWIFSDDLNYAKYLFEGVSGKFSFVLAPKESPASETIMLMSRFRFHVIANSTFSWWGAALSRDSIQICYPDPWFKNFNFDNTLIFPMWKPIAATWA